MLAEIREQPEVIARLCDRAGPQLRALGRHLRRKPPVTVVPGHTIPRSEGKALRVVDRRSLS